MCLRVEIGPHRQRCTVLALRHEFDAEVLRRDAEVHTEPLLLHEVEQSEEGDDDKRFRGCGGRRSATHDLTKGPQPLRDCAE